jgi:predicted Zn-dependent protease
VHWRWRIVVAALLAALGLSAFLGWRWDRDRAERQEALRAAEHGRFGEAEPLLLRVAQRHLDDAEVAKRLALGYVGANRLAEAEPYFARWCEARPEDLEPYKQRIGLWLRWSRLRNAADDARYVLEHEPDNQQLRQQRARWLFIMGRFEEAESECNRVLRTTPNSPWMLLLQAGLHERQGHLTAAAVVSDQLLRDRPTFVEAVVLRASLHLEMDQPGEAIPLLRKALAEPGPHRRAALYDLGRALARTGQTEEAERTLAEARLLHDLESVTESDIRDNPNLQARVAEGLLNAGQPEKALGVLTKILQQDPNSTAAHRVLAAYYEKQGQPELAAEHRRRAEPTP